MDWLSINKNVLQGPCSSLGWYEGAVYMPSPDCEESLKDLQRELAVENIVSRHFRRNLGLSRIVQKDLVPILVHTKDQGTFSAAIRVLVNLTLPVECLLPIPIVSCSAEGQETISQLQQLLMDAKRAFLDDRATTAILHSIRTSLHQNSYDKVNTQEDCFHINNMLMLFRNILHMPDKADTKIYGASVQNYAECQAMQNKLIWNLFAQGLDVALLLMINASNKDKLIWTATMVQLIALLFKDQNVAKIQKTLSMVSETSDSSEDDMESDTSKSSGHVSGSGLSCESSKEPASNYTTPSDSGYTGHLDEWSVSSSSPSLNNMTFDYVQVNPSSDKKNRHSVPSDFLHECQMDFEKTDTSFTQNNTRLENSEKMVIEYKEDNVFNNRNCITASEKVSVVRKVSVTSDFGGSLRSFSSSDELRNKSCFPKEYETLADGCKQKQQFRLSKFKSESDSSNDDEQLAVKRRSHPPVGWKVKGEGDSKYQGCSSSVCLNAALEVAARKGHSSTKEAILEKRRKVCMVADNLTHKPSDEDISNLLRDFTQSFLHNGFCELVIDLKAVISTNNPAMLDKSHFLWLLTYFLKLSSTHELPYHHVSCIMSADMISYLTFEGVLMCEEVELLFHTQQMDIQPLLKRLHLLVTAFYELFNSIDNYCKKPISKRDKTAFHKLRANIADMTDARQLFLLLIRKYNSQVHSKQYLIDLISTNHILLLLLEKVYLDPESCEQFDLPGHVQQFGTIKIMEQYGKVLEDYEVNSEFVNDCVFTMMHHVAGETDTVCCLFHPEILKCFCKISEDDFETKEFWEDLMNFVLHEFMRVAHQCPEVYMQKLFSKMRLNSEDGSSPGISLCDYDRNSSEFDSVQKVNQKYELLYWWYLQYEHHSDPIGKIQEALQENHNSHSRKQILEALLSQGILSKPEYDALTSKEEAWMEESSSRRESSVDILSEEDPLLQSVRNMILAGNKSYIDWLQRSLLEACYIKSELREFEDHPVEDPVPFYCHATTQSIPLVPYNESQEAALNSEEFVDLLHMLGFHLPTDVGKVYPRIPSFWTADVMYSIAQQLGPASQQRLKFKPTVLEEILKSMHNSSEGTMEESSPCFTPPVHIANSYSTTSIQPHKVINQNNATNFHKILPCSSVSHHGSRLCNSPLIVPQSSLGASHTATSQGNNRSPGTSFPVTNWMTLASKSKSLPSRTT